MKAALAALRARLERVPADVRLLLAFLVALAPLRAMQTASMAEMGVDGGYYVEVARHVRDGQGLVSNLALYHLGAERLPYPSSIYPIWPVVLGLCARLFDLEALSHWLPLALSFTALIAAFLFGRRLSCEPLLPRWIPAFHAGHLLVLMLGLQHDFVYFSALPYTEPLSWTLLLLFLWRLLGADDSPRAGLEAGIGAVLIYLCRYQLIVVPLALLMAQGLRVLTGPSRARAAVQLGVSGAVIGGSMGAFWLWLRGFVPGAGLGALLRFDQNRASDLLEPFDAIVDRSGPLEVLADRAGGLITGWDPLNPESYQAVFYASHWALPLALLFGAGAAVAQVRREGLRAVLSALLERLRGPRALGWLTALGVAAGGLLSVQLAHKHFNGEWYFDRRQSMICVLAFFFAMAWLLRSARALPALLAGLLLATSTVAGSREVLRQALSDEGRLRADDRYDEIVWWLKRHSADGPLTVAMQTGKVQRVGWRTGKVGYHWFYDQTSYADLLKMTDVLGSTYVMYSEPLTRAWRFRREGAGQLEHDFETLPDRPDNLTVLRRRAAPLAPVVSPRVLVVGVDGASWRVIGPMIERGELPTFEKLRVEGASEVDFSTLAITRSPVIWTSVATGRAPEDHGVTDYTQELDGVGKVPVTSDARRVPALWGLASAAGRSVEVINWWASWPAEPVNGRIVSDHANPAAAGWMAGRYWDADPSALSALRADTWPEELAAQLQPAWIQPDAFPLHDLQARSRYTPAQLELLAAAPFNQRTAYSWIKTFFAVDRPHVQIALDQLREAQPDLTMLYLRGPDPVQHYAWDTVDPESYATLPPNLERDRGVVEGVYRAVDSYLAELLSAAAPDTLVIVLSDHGAEPAEGAKRARFKGRPGGHTSAARGVLFLWGPSVRRGYDIDGAGPLDIAPTVAWALGLPVADDLPGRVLSEAFTLDFRERRGRERVPTWGTREAHTSAGASPADANMMEQLRGLGYIE